MYSSAMKNREQVHDAINVAVETFRRLDVVFNNAGYENLISIKI
jgi:NADP-dependent 3-hydroxy acid dehydrogenase YdfG